MSTRINTVLPLPLERRASRTQVKESVTAVPKAMSERPTRKRTSSWDPFEVWRTRVKSPPGPE